MQIIKKVCAIVINKSWKVLIFKEKLPWKGFLFNIPKWTFDKTLDNTLWDCMKREIYEETNIKNIFIENVIDLIPKYYENSISIITLFLISIWEYEKMSNLNIENNENIKDYNWINKNDFINMLASDFIDQRIYNILYNYFFNNFDYGNTKSLVQN